MFSNEADSSFQLYLELKHTTYSIDLRAAQYQHSSPNAPLLRLSEIPDYHTKVLPTPTTQILVTW